MSSVNTFNQIKLIIHQILPSAKVYLFGSRANNTQNEDSDWDVLILEETLVTRELKRNIQDALYPFSLTIGSFINILLVNEKEWKENPGYYSIKLSISRKPILS